MVNKNQSQALYHNRSEKTIQYAITAIENSDLCADIVAVYLYGSCARLEQTFESDVDLLVQMADNFEIAKHSTQILLLKNAMMPDDLSLPEVDVKVVVGDQWKKNKDLFFTNVRKDGKQIWQQKII